MTGGFGNGDPPARYEASATDWYDASWQNIVERYPRARQVGLYKQIEALVRLFPPEEYAERIGEKTWMFVTQEGLGVPEIDIFFTVEGERVTLQDAIADA